MRFFSSGYVGRLPQLLELAMMLVPDSSVPQIRRILHVNSSHTTEDLRLIQVGHSPDPDDAFMFYALAKEKIATAPYRFEHELVDIETLNRRAFSAELELTAISLHAYAYLAEKYAICACGASMGDKYGPMVVARSDGSLDSLKQKTIAVPGTLTEGRSARFA